MSGLGKKEIFIQASVLRLLSQKAPFSQVINANLNFENAHNLFTLTMACQFYRNVTLGNILQKCLNKLIQSQQLLFHSIFDKAINSALAQFTNNNVNFWCSLLHIHSLIMCQLFYWMMLNSELIKCIKWVGWKL